MTMHELEPGMRRGGAVKPEKKDGTALPEGAARLLALQRSAGNQAVGALARRTRRPATARPAHARVQRSGQPRVQRWAPLAGLGALLTAESTATAVGVVSGIAGLASTGAGAGAAVAPGQTGVQEVQLSKDWMSREDQETLKLIVQYRFINEYVRRVSGGSRGSGEGSDQGGGNEGGNTPNEATQAQLDAAVVETSKTTVRRAIEREFNDNQYTTYNRNFVWSDSGSHTADMVGTVGEIMFTDVTGTYLRETLRLEGQARDIPGLQLASEGEMADVRMFRGGRIVRGPNMSTGWNDNLAINLAGGAATIDEAGNNGHGIHVYDTAWSWDENTTRWAFEVKIKDYGIPDVTARESEGNPDDFGLW